MMRSRRDVQAAHFLLSSADCLDIHLQFPSWKNTDDFVQVAIAPLEILSTLVVTMVPISPVRTEQLIFD